MRLRLVSASLLLSVFGAGVAAAQVAAPKPPTTSPHPPASTPAAAAGAHTPTPAAGGAGSAKRAAATLALAGKQIDINHATAADLETVPGIGDAYAAKIIAGRPYTDKGQLRSKHVLPAAVYAKVKERLVAHTM